MNSLTKQFQIKKMKKLTKKVVASVIAVALVGGLYNPISAQAYSSSDKLVLTYNENDPLYAATHFHMFANEKIVNENVHTHGNIAAKEAEAHEFGTRYRRYPDGVSKEYTYIEKLISADSNALAGTLILGPGHKIISEPNANQTIIENPDGKQIVLNQIPSSRIYIEPEGFKALDLDAEFAKLKALSNNWGKETPNNKIIYSLDTRKAGVDMNNRYIDLKDVDMTTGKVFGKVTYQEYTSSPNPLKIFNVDSNKANKGLFVLNIDLAGAGDNVDLTLNQGINGVDKNGNEYQNEEWDPSDFATCRIIYNLIDSSAVDGVYHGNVSMKGTISGTILAPAADVVVGAVNGTVVAKNIKHVDQESHRWDVWPEDGVELKEYKEPTTQATTTEKKTEATTATTEKTTEVTTTEATTEKKTEVTTTEKTTEVTTTEATTEKKTEVTTTEKTTEVTTTEATTEKKTEVTTTEATTEATTEKATEAVTTEATTEATTEDITEADIDNPKEEGTGDLEIVITDEVTDKPVPGAKVEVTNPDGDKSEHKTDSAGTVVVKDTPAGDHKVVVKEVPKGYNVTTGKEVVVNVQKGEKTKKVVTRNKKDAKNAKKALKYAYKVKTGDEGVSVTQTREVSQVGANNKKITKKYNKKLKSYKKKHKKQAKEIAAWINIAGTKINYPVMYTGLGSKGNKYLQKNIDGKKDPHGMIYASYLTPKRRISYNLAIYGHNMKDGTMFTDLAQKYEKQSFYKNHKYVKLDTQGYNYVYEVVDVIRVSCDNKADQAIYTKFADLNNKKVYKQWKKQVAKNREYKCSGKYTRNDDLMILSTCEYTKSNGRFVVICKQIKCNKVKK